MVSLMDSFFSLSINKKQFWLGILVLNEGLFRWVLGELLTSFLGSVIYICIEADTHEGCSRQIVNI